VNFLAPAFFWGSLVVAAGVVALHFLVTRQPPSHPLPTVRFIPAAPVRATAVDTRPEDLVLLLLRVLIILLIGAAFARPVFAPRRRAIARLVLADLSRAVAAVGPVRDSLRAIVGPGDVVVAFDSSARLISTTGSDWVETLAAADVPGRLSAALVVAFRAAASLRASADSIELVIVSPLRGEEWDAATPALRALWPGRIRLVAVAGTADSLEKPKGIRVSGAADDPVAVAASLIGRSAADTTVHIARGDAGPADSAWAAAGSRVLVRWPATGAPPGWQRRTVVDTSGAVVTAAVAVVFPFERRWRPDSAPRGDIVVARWADGEPAALERPSGLGCVRDVGIPVTAVGDFVLRADFARLLRTLSLPCRMSGSGRPVGLADTTVLAGSGGLAARGAIRPLEAIATPLVPWLLAAALGVALLELFIRRGGPALTDVEADS
jgi:hypothetical protein